MIGGLVSRFTGLVRSGWRYNGVSNKAMQKHVWSATGERLEMYFMDGAGDHCGFVVEVTGRCRDGRLSVSNGFVEDMFDALILADLYMRDDMQSPAAFMHSERVRSQYTSGGAVRQDEWLAAHRQDYEFSVVCPGAVGSVAPQEVSRGE